jgi:single-strand DNA-binding protein
MPGLNRVQLIGRLGKDPESRFIPTGKKVCTFTLAVNKRWKTGGGETKEHTDWFYIEAWGRLGEICQQYLGKGRLLYIEGRLQTDRYEQEGETRYFTKVIAKEIQMLDRKEEEEILVEVVEEE